jgi:glycosyltransferase involved in cell wall biosynthesis
MLSVLMTVYNENRFIDKSISACLPYVDHLVIVEGAYQEVIKLGKPPRSSDGTIKTIHDIFSLSEMSSQFILNMPDGKVVQYIEANELSDKDQRNVGLEAIKKLNPDGWLLIIDGDEIYDPDTFSQIKVVAHTMQRQDRLAAHFKSVTFVNDARHCVNQNYPRLFRITPGCKFVNDNFMAWNDRGIGWFTPYVIKIPYVRFYHFAFCKGLDRLEMQNQWWNTRFNKPVNRGWDVDKTGKIVNPYAEIEEFDGKLPIVMLDAEE